VAQQWWRSPASGDWANRRVIGCGAGIQSVFVPHRSWRNGGWDEPHRPRCASLPRSFEGHPGRLPRAHRNRLRPQPALRPAPNGAELKSNCRRSGTACNARRSGAGASPAPHPPRPTLPATPKSSAAFLRPRSPQTARPLPPSTADGPAADHSTGEVPGSPRRAADPGPPMPSPRAETAAGDPGLGRRAHGTGRAARLLPNTAPGWGRGGCGNAAVWWLPHPAPAAAGLGRPPFWAPLGPPPPPPPPPGGPKKNPPPDGVVLIDYMGANVSWASPSDARLPKVSHHVLQSHPEMGVSAIGEGGTPGLIGFTDRILAIFPKKRAS